MKKRFSLILAICLIAVICAPVCFAENTWQPSGAIRLIVPFGAGGQTDLVSRAAAQAIEEVTGWTIVVENVTGSGGMIGAAEAIDSKPDGQTWLASSIGLVTSPIIGTAPDGVSWENLENIAMVCSNPGCITVAASSKFQTINDFIEAAKAEPESISIANGGAGGSYHLMALSVQNQAGCEFLHVPYSDGTAAAVVSALGGHDDAVVSSPGEVNAQVAAGDMRILAVAADERYSACPDVPTFKESGINVSMATFCAISLPKGTSTEVCKAVEEATLKASEQASFITFMKENNYGIDVRDSEAFQAMLEEQDRLYSEVVDLLA